MPTMDPNVVVASAQQAALSSVEHALSGPRPSSDMSPREGISTRSKTHKKDALNSTKGSPNGVTGSSEDTSHRQRSNSSNIEEGEIRGSSSKSSTIDLTRDDDDEAGDMPDGDAGEMSFVIDTAGDMDVDRGIALEDETKADNGETHVEAGLLLPTHVNVIPQADKAAPLTDGSSAGPSRDMTADIPNDDENLEGDMGDFEQLDMDPSTANRYYGAEEKAERRAKEQCLACGELGHDRRHCPHQHCLACGAMDEHPTRFCPLSTSCFRCGGMGHQTRTCPKPRRGPRSEDCERCGSYNHVKALCPTLWRVYTYSKLDDYDRHRSKMFFKLQSGSSARDPRRDLEPDPAELSDSEDEFVRAGEPEAPTGSGASQFDPAMRWCYNCSSSGNHWGDDCPEPRVNPTRGTGEPSAFSEFVSRLGPFAKFLPGAPPLAGFQMPSSQFTFSVGSSATMHVAGDVVPVQASRTAANGSNGSRRGQSSRDDRGGGGSSSGAIAIGLHMIGSRDSSRTSSPHPNSSVAGSSRSRAADSERLVSFDRTKAIECEGGEYLLRKEKKKGKKPLPEHLFRQWIRDKQDYPEHADEIRTALERRADLEAKGLDTRDVPSTRDIVGNAAGSKKSKRDKDRDRDSDRPSKKRRGDSASDPVIIDESDDDEDAYRFEDSSDSSDSDKGGRRKRRGDGKDNRKTRSQRGKQSEVHTGWGHHGDGSSSKGKGNPGGRFSSKRKGGSGSSNGNDNKQSRGSRGNGGGGGGNGGGKKRGRKGGSGGGGGGGGGSGSGGKGGSKPKNNGGQGEKIRGGGSKYRGGYF